MTQRFTILYLVLAIIGIVGYTLPWLVNPSTALTMGAYDLAEWASLHPQVHFESDLLLTSLLLRWPLAALALIMAFVGNPHQNYFYFRLITFAGIALYLLPPLEFFTIARSNANYLQQFLLVAALVVIGGTGFVFLTQQKWRYFFTIVSSASGVIGSIWGVLEIADLMNGFALNPRPGLGVLFVVASFGLILAFAILNKQSSTKAALNINL